MITVREAVRQLLAKGIKPLEIANEVGVTDAMVSTWKNKDNDYCPRLPIAKKFYKVYDITLYPYAEEALRDDA